jgi:hypothetical protein
VLAVSLALALILAGGALAHGQTPSKVPRRKFQVQAPNSDQSFSGVITDSKCGARHVAESNMSSAECARFCVRNGAQYLLVDGEKNSVLGGDTSKLSKLAGQRVRITGTRTGDRIDVVSIAAE